MLGQGADSRPPGRVRREEKRIREALVQVLQDGHRLDQDERDPSLLHLQGGDEPEGATGPVLRMVLLSGPQVDGTVLVVKPLQAEADPHPLRGGRPPVGVKRESHDASTSLGRGLGSKGAANLKRKLRNAVPLAGRGSLAAQPG